MIQNKAQQEAWFAEQKEAWAHPNTEQNSDRYARTLPKRCPCCGGIFFAFQKEGFEQEPYKQDPDSYHGEIVRETCGDPTCWDNEDMYQFRKRVQHRERFKKVEPEPPKHLGRKIR